VEQFMVGCNLVVLAMQGNNLRVLSAGYAEMLANAALAALYNVNG
jgi:hypothetical protein